jgi:D-alanyl-D-alanine carboxypeptidase/D-alanyl-D-alanine-endopeptidase (penicillin-binding protein 4)
MLAVLAVVAAVVAAWPSPRHGAGSRPALAAPVLDAARVPAFVSQTAANVRLGQRLDNVLAGRAQSCLAVDDSRGPTVYRQRPDLSLLPASNLKLLTATAVLARIPESERLQTEARAVRPPVGGVVNGDLWVVGAGDPLLATADFSAQAGYQHQPRPRTALEDLADTLVAAGVRQVQGRILGDETRYDTQRVVPTWSPSYLTNGEVGPMSALTVNDNFSQWTPREIPAPSPAANASSVLARLLVAHGVQVGGTGEGAAPPTATTVVGAVDSAPIADLVGVVLTQSDNLGAELLTKELGRRFAGAGTTAAGLGVTRSALQDMHLPLEGVAMVDGSGLDRSDRLTCDALQATLAHGGENGELGRILPVAGRNGTLARRFIGTPAAGRIRAKTGSLKGVNALSGWASTSDGRSLQFALVANDLPNEATGTSLEDRVVSALALWPQAPALTDISPLPAAAGTATPPGR